MLRLRPAACGLPACRPAGLPVCGLPACGLAALRPCVPWCHGGPVALRPALLSPVVLRPYRPGCQAACPAYPVWAPRPTARSGPIRLARLTPTRSAWTDLPDPPFWSAPCSRAQRSWPCFTWNS